MRSEYVVAVRGEVVERPAETVNPNLPTGEIEVMAARAEGAERRTPPAVPDRRATARRRDDAPTYRYLDLRRPKMQQNLMLRHRLTKAVRDYLDDQGFVEVETPDADAQHAGRRARLPGAEPRQPRQLLRAAAVAAALQADSSWSPGFDRYFQIARCFRDEDLRADRQPEFTQIDIEMSFVAAAEDIYR